jgi:putative addiction module component (TIGR02574 family)
MTKAQILKAAKGLSLDDRMDVAEELFAGLGADEREEIGRAWADEIESRVDDLEKGRVKPVSADEVFEQIRKKHVR